MKPLIFNSKDIRVEIRLPSDKARDLNDEYDMREAVKEIVKQWLELESDVRHTLRIIKVEPKVKIEDLLNTDKRLELP